MCDFPNQSVGVLDMRMEHPAELPGLWRFEDRATRAGHGAGQLVHLFRGVYVVRQRDSRDLCMVAG
ncbi:Uncharacterised protein [Mycobacteroides abscessus subsp. massiliense]|nr:Uncharacterised protein [Mycobacteroides abscessus subsp. massiliense]